MALTRLVLAYLERLLQPRYFYAFDHVSFLPRLHMPTVLPSAGRALLYLQPSWQHLA